MNVWRHFTELNQQSKNQWLIKDLKREHSDKCVYSLPYTELPYMERKIAYSYLSQFEIFNTKIQKNTFSKLEPLVLLGKKRSDDC